MRKNFTQKLVLPKKFSWLDTGKRHRLEVRTIEATEVLGEHGPGVLRDDAGGNRFLTTLQRLWPADRSPLGRL